VINFACINLLRNNLKLSLSFVEDLPRWIVTEKKRKRACATIDKINGSSTGIASTESRVWGENARIAMLQKARASFLKKRSKKLLDAIADLKT